MHFFITTRRCARSSSVSHHRGTGICKARASACSILACNCSFTERWDKTSCAFPTHTACTIIRTNKRFFFFIVSDSKLYFILKASRLSLLQSPMHRYTHKTHVPRCLTGQTPTGKQGDSQSDRLTLTKVSIYLKRLSPAGKFLQNSVHACCLSLHFSCHARLSLSQLPPRGHPSAPPAGISFGRQKENTAKRWGKTKLGTEKTVLTLEKTILTLEKTVG